MGYSTPDPYAQPEQFGLEVIGEFDITEPCYSFNIFAVFKHKETGQLYYETDSGCSCPSPFEDTTMPDLKPVTRAELTQLILSSPHAEDGPTADWRNLLNKINAL